MANRIAASELEQFLVTTVQLTGRVLGAGAYGSVEEVEIPGATVAAKKLHETLVKLGSPQQVEKWVRDFVEECKLMSQLRHPHVVQFLGVCYLPGAPLPVLLMEKLLTSLDNLLETSPNIPLHFKVHFLGGTSQGLVYLHSHTPPIAHRDLSAKNILVDNGLNAKISDLGISRIVNVQPGQLAATMTQMPGTGVYMPPEAGEEKGATRYNTSIDIFSLGVVSLFTLTQTFPKDLKPATYFDPVTQRVLGRTEVERRENHIVEMKANLGETHPLVELTLDCLEYIPNNRPSAVGVLRRLEEVGTTLPQNCTQTKLQLIQQIMFKDKELELKDWEMAQIMKEKNHLQANVKRLQIADVNRLQTINNTQSQIQAANDSLKTANKTLNQIQAANVSLKAQNQVLKQRITQEQDLSKALRSEFDSILGEVRLLKMQASRQRKMTVAKKKASD